MNDARIVEINDDRTESIVNCKTKVCDKGVRQGNRLSTLLLHSLMKDNLKDKYIRKNINSSKVIKKF